MTRNAWRPRAHDNARAPMDVHQARHRRTDVEARLFLGHGEAPEEDGTLDDNALVEFMIARLPPALAARLQFQAAPDAHGDWPRGCGGTPQLHLSAASLGWPAAAGGIMYAPGAHTVWALHAWAAHRGTAISLHAVLGPARALPASYRALEAAAAAAPPPARAGVPDVIPPSDGAPLTKDDMDKIAKTARRVVAPREAVAFTPELLVAEGASQDRDAPDAAPRSQ